MYICSMKMKIIPNTEEFDAEVAHRISYCYLHGKIQDDAGYDCFGFQNFIKDLSRVEGYIQPGTIEDGIYECEFKDKPCTFFYWNSNDTMGRHRGLVVYNDDTEAYNYAKDCYNKKTICL